MAIPSSTVRVWRAAVVAALVLLSADVAMAGDSAPAEQISAFRLKHGEGRVSRDAALDRIAMEQARAMAEKDDLSHEVLGPFTRRVAPSKAGRAAENIAYGYDSFDKTLGQWIDSPGHRRNLLLHNASRVGIASARNASGKRVYWAMVIAGDYESDKPKGAPKSKGKSVVAQTKPDANLQTRWGAKPPASASKECHLSIKVIGLCI